MIVCKLLDTTLLFELIVQKYIYISVSKMHAGFFRVSVIHRTTTWTTAVAMSRFGPSGKAGKRTNHGSTTDLKYLDQWVRLAASAHLSLHKLWFVDTVSWLRPATVNETLKWLTSLRIVMPESFW